MKKWKPMLAAVLAFGMLASVTSCGDSEKDSSSDKGSSSDMPVISGGDAFEGEIGVPDSDEIGNVEEKTEAPTENKELYKHYDLLAAEYEKTGNTSPISLICFNGFNEYGDVAFCDGKVMFSYFDGKNKYSLFIYDINTKELIEIPVKGGSYLYYQNGYLYSFTGQSIRDGIVKYDLKGNEVASITLDFEKYTITDEGYIYVLEYPRGSYIISPDLSTVSPMPDLTIKDSHGLETAIDGGVLGYGIVAAYGNKLLAVYDNVLYYFDVDNMTWSKSKFTDAPDFVYNCKTYGKYLVNNETIFDMETEEIVTERIANFDGEIKFADTYFGGMYNIVHINDNYRDDKGAFYCVQFPEIAADDYERHYIEDNNAVALGTDIQEGSIHQINDAYYIFKDNKGIFLRTYEKGETEEEIVYVFNK